MHEVDVRICRALLDEWYEPDIAPETILTRCAATVGGHITIVRPSRRDWTSWMRDSDLPTVYGFTSPAPGGWLCVLPQLGAGDVLTAAHEAAHIFFGDVPHWRQADAATRARFDAALSALADQHDASSFINDGAVSLRQCTGPKERRAEFLGAIFAARASEPRGPRNSVDALFGMRDML